MKISKITNIKEKSNLILLTRSGQDLDPYISDHKQLAYTRERIDQEKDAVLLNQLDHIIIIARLDREDTLINLRLESARKAGFSIHPTLQQYDTGSVVVVNCGVEAEESIAFTEGLALTNYQFLKYRTGEDIKRFKLEEILLSDDHLRDDHVEKLANLVKGVYYTRDLVNEPLSYLTAVQLSSEIEKMGEEAGFAVEVFNKKKIESLKMGGLLAVNKGSVDPPTFSILTWKPDAAVNTRPIILVGKGVVYDTGGLSLKPTHDSMDYMKCDMGGAAAVAGAIYTVAKNKLPVWIIGLIPATDNRPDGNAYVPGDVVTMFNGTTVEVLNTDAEGRMLLADALSYAKQYDPEVVIELSTLTGAAQAAVDKYGIVGMGNASREIMDNLKESGEYTSERIAEFPFWDEYKEQLKSDIADLKNIGGKYAGAITAGKFLEHFTNYPYIHLDIAGPSYNKIAFNYRGKGGSGVGVRILYNYLLNRSL
ncbi:MAG: leucyl aminopeptidase [Bacteroidales bacterium]|nr:leucyl aminopeptidase [Bacteroidales bacterium]